MTQHISLSIIGNRVKGSVNRAFVDILGDDKTVLEREDIRISPAYLMRLNTVLVEMPEGS